MPRWKVTLTIRTAAGAIRTVAGTSSLLDPAAAESAVIRSLLHRQPGAEIIGTEIERMEPPH
jgi:hypothetical protein